MRTTQCWVLSTVLIALAACGGSDEPQAPAAAPGAASAGSANVSASAEEVAEAARGDVDCPAELATAPRADGAPVDDVVGVRPGMTYEEAANIVLCTADLMVVEPANRGFELQTYGQTVRQGFSARFAEPRVEKTSEQIMEEMQDDFIARSGNRVAEPDMKPGQSKWHVGTLGMPGEERVISAAREEWFEAGRNPPLPNVEQALLAKYGTPTRSQDASGRRYITWAYDPMGRLVTETSPLFQQCNGNADPDGGVNLSLDCGVVVMAIVYPLPDNPALAQNFQVGVVDQAGGYERLTATEKAFQELEDQRKAKQVEDATKNAAEPTL